MKDTHNDTEYFSEGNVTLYNASCLNRGLFRKPFADLVLTSPPYCVGINYGSSKDSGSYDGYLKFSRQWMSNAYAWARPQCRFALNVPVDVKKYGHHPISADLTAIAQDIGWQYQSTISWNKNNVSSRFAWGSWKSASAPNVVSPIENIIVFYKDEWKKTNGSRISDITGDEFKEWTYALWSITGESKKRIGHPAPFPRELARRLIKIYSYVGDTVLDCFSGSGTTLIEAQLNNRSAIGVELDFDYCELAKQRILKECFEEKKVA